MSKTIYRPEFLAFLKEHNLGTPASAIERLRCLGLRFQDSKVRALVKTDEAGGMPGAYFHHKKSKRIIGGEWLGYDKLCELLLKARERFDEANGVEPKKSKAEMIVDAIREYEERVVASAARACGTLRCHIGKTHHGKETGNFWLKFHPDNGTDVELVHDCAHLIVSTALKDLAVYGHKVKITTVLDCNFCQITVDSGHVRAAITKNLERESSDKQGALPIEGTDA